MINSEKRTIKVEIPNGPILVCNNCWDYKTNLNETSFKTSSNITKEHPLLKIKSLDLTPIISKKLWLVTILRRAESNLKDEKNPTRKVRK